ncbi:MAG: hypothetical protein ACREHD_01820 [Pirellulales bacterium]
MDDKPIINSAEQPPSVFDMQSFMEDLARPEPPPQGGFSLASLFLLVTAAGVIALLARSIVETKIEVTLVVVHAVIGGFVGGIVGAIIGAGYPRLLAGLALGWFIGTVTGAVCAATAASGGSPWLFCVGAAALVALGVASRWMHREA